jgi:exodeoxyribonuclease V alpha subunit
MRGGLRRWKRGVASHGVRSAVAYATDATCDAHMAGLQGVEAALAYGGGAAVSRFEVTSSGIREDRLSVAQLRRWVSGEDPDDGTTRGRRMHSPNADLLLDGTINFPKSISLAALVDPGLAIEFEALQDRLRHRILEMWQCELNARRGAGGRVREEVARLEVVELKHRRSRALDPHVHRHLWLGIKVQGTDGQWSNVDSRVAMKFHTVVNAEGELAARTDPQWVQALAARGYTITADGEITELVDGVRPFSRRSNQIEANRLSLIATWREEHPGREPGPEELHHIDERAWAIGRPNKPSDLDESEWEERVRDELARINPALLHAPAPLTTRGVPIALLDREALAAGALTDADDRSVSSSGRFSPWDIRAGAIRAIAQAGIIVERDLLDELIEDVAQRALAQTIDLIRDDSGKPSHIKALMAKRTVMLKLCVANLFAGMSSPGRMPTAEAVVSLGRAVDPTAPLTPGQRDAVAAIVGSGRLVTVVGPAGAGKTTILKVAVRGLSAQQRRMVIVAPTKKAANVAEREVGAPSSSIHSLLHDHGYRWSRDATGTQAWERLTPGQVDPASGHTYAGPRQYLLRADDRIVVDEAGMVDLQTARALAELTEEVGAGLALVGDPQQAAPVGHAGAMALAQQSADVLVELTDVHRFSDPEYGALTMRMRKTATHDEALGVAAALDDAGHVIRVESAEAARTVMVDAWFESHTSRQRLALVTASKEEAHAINEAIQQRRIESGELSPKRVALGHDGQPLLEGDIIQTRRNDQGTGVQNRATWMVTRVRHEWIEVQSAADTTDRRHIPIDYVAEHVHLAYATTVHGIQGDTTHASIVGPDVDAAGLYVGLTRGRMQNRAIVVARSQESAREAIAETLTRAIAENTVEQSRAAAATDLARAARDRGPDPSWTPATAPEPTGTGMGI